MRHVVAVCQSEKKARVRVAKVLDRYLWRVGQFTWRGRASNACLKRMSSELRRGASRSTAVAVHEVKDGSAYRDPLFTIGSRSAFGDRGVVPLSVRSRPSPARHPGLAHARAVLLISAFLHDLGKAGSIFQAKMRASHGNPDSRLADPVRHELISAIVFDALTRGCRNDEDAISLLRRLDSGMIDAAWSAARNDLTALADPDLPAHEYAFVRKGGLLADIGLLVLGHHRLPAGARERLTVSEHVKASLIPGVTSSDFLPSPGVPFWHDPMMVSRVQLFALDLRPGVVMMTDLWLRTCLMVADHMGSADKEMRADAPEHIANLINGEWADDLITHTSRVMRRARLTFDGLMAQADGWPSLTSAACPTSLTGGDPDHPVFGWQARSCEAAAAVAATGGGFFGCVMAGTGTGKTRGLPALLASAVMSDPEPGRRRLRFNLGLGLRTLASQSAKSYVRDLGFRPEDLRFLIGRPVIDFPGEDDQEIVAAGPLRLADSGVSILSPDAAFEEEGLGDLSWDPDEDPPLLLHELGQHDQDVKGLMGAPVMVGTIDQVMASVHPVKSRHLIASARVMTSDLIIDEIDQFGPEDLAALYRLVHQFGACGRRVIIASATAPLDVAQSAFAAYRKGWKLHAGFRGVPDKVSALVCGHVPGALITEAGCEDITAAYKACAEAQQRGDGARRRMPVVLDDADTWDGMIERIFDACQTGHEEHSVLIGDARVSVGLVRLSKVRHVIAAAAQLARLRVSGVERRFVCLHSRMPLGARSHVEDVLSASLSRKGHDPHKGLRNLIRERGLEHIRGDLSIIVIASPVIETGNDLDFDYAVLEPFDSRSLIQASGRVRRHRDGPAERPNVFILPRSLVVMETGKLSMPGIETSIAGMRAADLGDCRNDARSLLGSACDDVDARHVLDRVPGSCPSADHEAALRERFLQGGGAAPALDEFLSSIPIRMGKQNLEKRKFRRPGAPEVTLFTNDNGVWRVRSDDRRIGDADLKHKVSAHLIPNTLIPDPLGESISRIRQVPIRRMTEVRVLGEEADFISGEAGVMIDPFLGIFHDRVSPDHPFGKRP